jgi:hypothetical protein
VDLAAGELNKEEDVEALEPGRLDSEEVGRQHLGGVLADEFPPAGLAAARSGRDALAAQDLGHPHVGNLKAQLQRLALDALVPPARVLSGEAKDTLTPLRVAHRARARRASMEGDPLAPDQVAVPAEQGLRPGQQRRQA